MAADMALEPADAVGQQTGERRFETLIQAHRGIVFKVANAYCRDPEDRQDLAQEIVTQVWRAFPAFDESRKFSTWMYRIALNVAISFQRREAVRGRHVTSVDPDALANVADPFRSESDPRVRDLYRLIDTLDDLNRALVLLHLEGYDHREIGFVLGISEPNVATKLTRIRQQLRGQTRVRPGSDRGQTRVRPGSDHLVND
jgi:RNA polymerase sigma-70 factor (ECF subfamily)